MSSRRELNPGQTTLFPTRSLGLQTQLFAIPWPPDPNVMLPTLLWHIELGCQPDRIERGVLAVDISVAGGALVTVRNIQTAGIIQVWTDYI